jgi:hypothetical protein
LVNARTAALNNSNSASEHIKNQIVQTLTEAGGEVDYVEVILEPFLSYLSIGIFLKAFFIEFIIMSVQFIYYCTVFFWMNFVL